MEFEGICRLFTRMLMLEVQQSVSVIKGVIIFRCFHIVLYPFMGVWESGFYWSSMIKYGWQIVPSDIFDIFLSIVPPCSFVFHVPSCCMFILQFLNWFSVKFLGSPGMPIRTSLAIGCCVALKKLHAGLKRSTPSICSFARDSDFTSEVFRSLIAILSRKVRSHSLARWKQWQGSLQTSHISSCIIIYQISMFWLIWCLWFLNVMQSIMWVGCELNRFGGLEIEDLLDLE